MYLWEYWKNMSARRTGNGFGPNALSHAEVRAWEQRSGVRLAPFEADAIDTLEQIYLSYHAEQNANKAKGR